MLNPIEEAKFAELKDKCRELKVAPPPDIMIGLKVHNKNGVLVFDDIQRGHSWTRNFYNCLAYYAGAIPFTTNTFGAGYINWKTLSQGVRGIGETFPTGLWAAVGGIATATGIVVGTGDTAFSTEQFNLVTLISHGNSANQLSYSAQTATTGAYTAGTKTWAASMVRQFNNNSGSSITVKETGIYQPTGYVQMMERSVLDPTVAVANGAQLTVTYKISMDFSAID